MNVFVYGSLMSGMHNHALLERYEAQRVGGVARTRPEMPWALFDLGSYPAMAVPAGEEMEVDAKGNPLTRVVGEVWEVGPAGLAALDRLEGVASRYYRRTAMLVEVETLGEYPSEMVLAAAYVQTWEQVQGRTRVPGGDWREYLRRRGEEGWGRAMGEVLAKRLR